MTSVLTLWLIVFCARCASCALDVSVRNICARFSPNAEYMRKILRKIVLISPMRKYAQDLRKIVLISPMRNICARLYLFPQCAIYAQDLRKIVLLSPMYKDCRHYWKKYVTYHISALNLEWYSLHSYFWIATGFDFFLNKQL